ncbi:MAG: hypothetical protein OCD02_10475 [Spirochaetaceae bacterium]
MFKKYCFKCGEISDNKYPLCTSCFPKTLNKKLLCTFCGIPTSTFVKICPACREKAIVYNSNYSFFSYSGLPKEILSQFKFKKDKNFAIYYSDLISDYIKNNFNNPILCPVPTSRLKRKLKNGYQLDSICKELVKNGINIQYLLRKHYSKTQKKLDRESRIKNLYSSFYLKSPKLIIESDIVLFDDVFTTGATINACAKKISVYGSRIYSITLSRD